MLATHYFLSLVGDFRRRYPRLKLSVFSDGATKIQAMIECGELDAGIAAKGDFTSAIAWRPLIRAEMVACVSRSHPPAGKRSLTLEESREPPLLYREGYFQRRLVVESMPRGD